MAHADSLLETFGVANVYLDDELRALRATLRRFVAKDVVPKADQWEEDRELPREHFEQVGSLCLLDTPSMVRPFARTAEYGRCRPQLGGLDGPPLEASRRPWLPTATYRRSFWRELVPSS